MTLRVAFLRAMLWSLALSAAIGVLAVLFSWGDLVWRVVGTGFLTAVACAIMLAASRLIDHDRTRPAGLLGMGAVIGEFLMALSLIWELPRAVLGFGREEQIALTMLSLGVAVLLLMVFLPMLHKPSGAVAARVGIVAVVATLAVCLLATWLPYRGYSDSGRNSYLHRHKWQETIAPLTLFGGLSVVTLLGVGGSDRTLWRWGGMAAGTIAGAMWLIDIWIGAGSPVGFVVFCTLTAAAAVTAHANLMCLFPLSSGQSWVRGGTIGSATVTAALVVLLAADAKFHLLGRNDDAVGRLAAAGGIIAGCGTLALCVLFRMNRKVDYDPDTAAVTDMMVVCPRCGKKQAIPVGDSACAGCDLRISIRIEEPRCPHCDYLLYGLTSDRCPECGSVVGAWPPVGAA